MLRIAIFFWICFFASSVRVAQEVRFEVRDTLLVSGASTIIPVEVYSFESVVSFQFSLAWDSSLTIVDISFDPVFEDGIVFNSFTDHINVSWLGPPSGLSLADASTFSTLHFDSRGCPGDSAMVRITQEYIPWEVGIFEDNSLVLEPPEAIPNLTTWRAPQILPFQDTLICLGDDVTVTAGCEDCVEINWEFGSSENTIIIDTMGVFPLTAISENDCLFQDTLSVGLDVFELDILNDTLLCSGDSIQLILPDTLASYNWSTGADGPQITAYSGGGVYTVSVTNINGCGAIDQATINTIDPPLGIAFAEPSILCPGDSSLLSLDTSSVDEIVWLDQKGMTIAVDTISIWVMPDSSQLFDVISTNLCGSDTAAVDIFLVEFEAGAGQDTCIAAGESLELGAFGGTSYRWIERDYPMTPIESPNPVVQPADSAWFVVEITNETGCVIVDSVLVEVATNPLAMIRPINLITPNGDGMNDKLFFPNLIKFPNNEVTVWSRWGQTVYQKSGYQQDEELWEGTHNDRPLPDGEYFYLLEVNGERIQQTLSIIRE